MNPKYKPNDSVYYYLDKWGTVIKTKVKSYTAVGFYFLEDNRVDSLVPEIELFDTEKECIEKTLIWNNAVIDGYKNEINRLVKINKQLEEKLESE